MPYHNLKFFVLTGEPGVGKTTLTKKISAALAEKGVNLSGFYTEEVRKDGVREGFDIVTMDGIRGRLARDATLLSPPITHRIGKYGVFVNEFETIAMHCLVKKDDSIPQLLVIDEIGKMEFQSEKFKAAMKLLFNHPGAQYTVLATIPLRKVDQLVENIRHNKRAKIWTITRQNRDRIHEEILKAISRKLELA